MPPASPLAAPHARSAAVGVAGGRKGSARRRRTSPVAWEQTTAEKTVEPRFVARPPRKSGAGERPALELRRPAEIAKPPHQGFGGARERRQGQRLQALQDEEGVCAR